MLSQLWKKLSAPFQGLDTFSHFLICFFPFFIPGEKCFWAHNFKQALRGTGEAAMDWQVLWFYWFYRFYWIIFSAFTLILLCFYSEFTLLLLFPCFYSAFTLFLLCFQSDFTMLLLCFYFGFNGSIGFIGLYLLLLSSYPDHNLLLLCSFFALGSFSTLILLLLWFYSALILLLFRSYSSLISFCFNRFKVGEDKE